MTFYVYVLKSLKDQRLYIGSTNNIERRIQEHNGGKSKYMLTSPKLDGFLVFPPLYMRFADFSDLMAFAEVFPSTKTRASSMFDFPDPLGPIMQLKFCPNGISVLWANDLKPCNTSLFILVMISSQMSHKRSRPLFQALESNHPTFYKAKINSTDI